MLELHVWGPGLGLPSIDAECLAAIIYLRTALSNDRWSLIPSNNPNNNPYQQLPALRDGPKWVAGYEHIQSYLAEQNNGEWDLDYNLNDPQRADRDAYISFLYSRGLPLLDLSLYVSSENYNTCTRSVLGELLTWPQSWILPHQLREQAKRRSEHLGLSALDVDTAGEEEDDNAGLTAQIPKSLRKPKQTLSGLFGRGTQKTRFRLDAVINDFLDPVQHMQHGKDWLIANGASSADCLAIAILSLMQIPEVPQPWLRETLLQKYTQLSAWAQQHASKALGDGAVSMSSITSGKTRGSVLPWSSPQPISWMESSNLAIEVITLIIPLVQTGYTRQQLPQKGSKAKNKSERRQQMYAEMRGRRRLFSQVMMACIGTTSALGWMVYRGHLRASMLFHAAKPARRNFGEAGALLGL